MTAPASPSHGEATEGWPVFYVRTSLDGVRNPLRAGHLFPHQDRRLIRGWAAAYGVEDGERRPWGLLPFVTTLVAPSQLVADQIVAQGLHIADARKLLGLEPAAAKKGRAA